MKSLQTKHTVVAALGGFVQWFDNTLFNVLLPLIIFNFVPQDLELNQSFTLLSAYSATLFTRPFGAFIFSHLSDYHGRKKVLAVIPFIMGMATLLLGLCPSIKEIGVAAPAFLLLFTFLHGFSSGGEWPASSTYLYEVNDKSRYITVGFISTLCILSGIFCANILITLSLETGNVEFTGKYSWRLLFLLSSSIAIVTAYMRSKLSESKKWTKPQETFKFSREFKKNKKALGITFLICAADGVIFDLFFNNLFPFTDIVINRNYEFLSAVLALGASYFILKISKKLGVMQSLKVANILFIIFSVIQMWLPNEISLGVYRLIYVLPGFLYLIPLVTKLPELFEITNRAFLLGFARNSSIFIFGGFGLLLLRIYFKPAGYVLALYILMAALLGQLGIYLLSKNEKSAS
jgi:MFS family permease